MKAVIEKISFKKKDCTIFATCRMREESGFWWWKKCETKTYKYFKNTGSWYFDKPYPLEVPRLLNFVLDAALAQWRES